MEKFKKIAEDLLKDPTRLLDFLKTGWKKIYARRSEFKHMFDDLFLLYRMVKSWATGHYVDVSRATILWAVVALVYFISPLDFFPDILPGGFLDDLAIFAMISKKIRDDLDKFKVWESKNGAKPHDLDPSNP